MDCSLALVLKTKEYDSTIHEKPQNKRNFGKKTVEEFARKTQGKNLLENGCGILGMIKIDYVAEFYFYTDELINGHRISAVEIQGTWVFISLFSQLQILTIKFSCICENIDTQKHNKVVLVAKTQISMQH